MNIDTLQHTIVNGLEDLKAHDIAIFDTAHLSRMFDRVIIASGASNRHTRALAMRVREKVKAAGGEIRGIEGMDAANGRSSIARMQLCTSSCPRCASTTGLKKSGGGLDAGGAGSIAERWRRPRSKPQFLTPSLKQASGQNRTEAGTTARNGHSLPAIPHEGPVRQCGLHRVPESGRRARRLPGGAR